MEKYHDIRIMVYNKVDDVMVNKIKIPFISLILKENLKLINDVEIKIRRINEVSNVKYVIRDALNRDYNE